MYGKHWRISPELSFSQFRYWICNHCFLAQSQDTEIVNFKMLHVLICKKAVKLDSPITCHMANHWKDKTRNQIISSSERISSGITFLFIRLFTESERLYFGWSSRAYESCLHFPVPRFIFLSHFFHRRSSRPCVMSERWLRLIMFFTLSYVLFLIWSVTCPCL